MTLAARELPEGTWCWLQDCTRWIGTWCFFVGYRLRVWRRERIPMDGPLVVVANHSAMVDGPLLYGLLGRRSSFLIKTATSALVAELDQLREGDRLWRAGKESDGQFPARR